MRFLILAFVVVLCFACSQETESVPCESGHGYLYKDGNEFVCPYTFRVKNAQKEWEEVKKPTIIYPDADDYYPTALRNSWSSYNIFMLVPSKYFKEEQYIVSLRTFDVEFEPCGEAKEIIFYRIAEEGDMLEYRTYKSSETFGEGKGQFVFFGKREMPSYDWYQVLKVCEGNSFYIKGEIVNE